MVKSRYIGDGHPTFNRNPYNGYINPYYWVDFPIPYYMEIMGVDRPWHIWRGCSYSTIPITKVTRFSVVDRNDGEMGEA